MENLTARQQEILREAGLPTEFEKLNVTQKMAIDTIEKMLSYLENKYNQSFTYYNYYPEEFNHPDRMEAIFVVDGKENVVTVSRAEADDSFTDNYELVMDTEAYTRRIEDFLDSLPESYQYQLYVHLKADIDPGKDGLLNRYMGTVDIAFMNISVEEMKASDIPDLFGNWLAEQVQENGNINVFLYCIASSESDSMDMEQIIEHIKPDFKISAKNHEYTAYAYQ